MTVAPHAAPIAPPPVREELEAHWMPFTGNRDFKRNPRLIVAADGCHFTTADGRRVFDGLSGLWCCGLGHGRSEIAAAVARQIRELDYSPAFQFGHPLSFRLANMLCELTPAGLDHVFFTGSGSEAADTSLKMARAYWRLKGVPTKTRLIGRARGYHGVNFGGIGVGGIGANRKLFGPGVDADHLPHTLLAENAFSRGMPAAGAGLADHAHHLPLVDREVDPTQDLEGAAHVLEGLADVLGDDERCRHVASLARIGARVTRSAGPRRAGASTRRARGRRWRARRSRGRSRRPPRSPSRSPRWGGDRCNIHLDRGGARTRRGRRRRRGR
ncbi:MAG TPA: aminotransferase class III-fold pyridoxal phosphate-dependent enzyme, partial [Pseudomonadales bacterium]|nr:aminotransferase class III-fold pyridoxal phosphate-dependent enzyme [Pseudomonadales bacterium]